MRFEQGQWHFYSWSRQGSKWVRLIADTESKQDKVQYMLNAYRVLLTRARAGMIICVPAGNDHKDAGGFPEDPSHLPEFYDGTYQYLKSVGLEEI